MILTNITVLLVIFRLKPKIIFCGCTATLQSHLWHVTSLHLELKMYEAVTQHTCVMNMLIMCLYISEVCLKVFYCKRGEPECVPVFVTARRTWKSAYVCVSEQAWIYVRVTSATFCHINAKSLNVQIDIQLLITIEE